MVCEGYGYADGVPGRAGDGCMEVGGMEQRCSSRRLFLRFGICVEGYWLCMRI